MYIKFPSDKNYVDLPDYAKIRKTEKYFSEVAERKERTTAQVRDFIEQLNAVLLLPKPQKLTEFRKLMESKEYENCSTEMYEIMTLRYLFLSSYLEQSHELEPAICNMSSFEEAAEVFQKVVFGLRRMEFGFPLEEQVELFTYMNEKHVSHYYLFMVFQCGVVEQQQKVAQQLSLWYQQMGLGVWEQNYKEWVMNNGAK